MEVDRLYYSYPSKLTKLRITFLIQKASTTRVFPSKLVLQSNERCRVLLLTAVDLGSLVELVEKRTLRRGPGTGAKKKTTCTLISLETTVRHRFASSTDTPFDGISRAATATLQVSLKVDLDLYCRDNSCSWDWRVTGDLVRIFKIFQRSIPLTAIVPTMATTPHSTVDVDPTCIPFHHDERHDTSRSRSTRYITLADEERRKKGVDVDRRPSYSTPLICHDDE